MRVLTFCNCYLFRCGFRKKPRQVRGRRPSSSQASACVLASWPRVPRLERLLSSSSSKALKFALESLPPWKGPQSTGWNEVQLVDSLVLLVLSSSLTLALTWFYCVHFDREKHPAISGIMMMFVNTTDTWRRTVPCTCTAPLPGTGFGCLQPVFSACPDRPRCAE